MWVAGHCLGKKSAESKRLKFEQWSIVLVALLVLHAGCGGGSLGSGSPAATLSANSLSFPDQAPGGAEPSPSRDRYKFWNRSIKYHQHHGDR
jgi:hypothetical protein